MKDRLVTLIDSELKKKLQIMAIEKRTNLTEITEKALKDYLSKEEKAGK